MKRRRCERSEATQSNGDGPGSPRRFAPRDDGHRKAAPALGLILLLAGCGHPTRVRANDFPAADRPVSPIVSARWSTEEERDRRSEAAQVMTRARLKPGMTVADIGAGEGYYTVRLAARVGRDGRVLAEDIVPAVRDQLADRVTREHLDNVSVKLGTPANPSLPPASFDRVFLVHMYHEIAQPYEFLWNLRPALKPDGLAVVVDADRPTANHGTPPELLRCEMQAVGYAQIDRRAMPSAGGYVALFQARGPRPAPGEIRGCQMAH